VTVAAWGHWLELMGAWMSSTKSRGLIHASMSATVLNATVPVDGGFDEFD
jgi:hypothetical protein